MKEKRPQQQRSEWGTLGLMTAAAILSALVLFTADSRGVPYESFGVLIWLGALTASFIFGLLYFAQFVLPLRGQDGWAQGFWLLLQHYNLLGQQFLNSLSAPKPKIGSPPPPIDPTWAELWPSFFNLRAGFVKSHHALALAKGTGFSRAAGPGFVVLFRDEAITHIVDLRLHRRQQLVKAASRDGIPIETTLFISFRVKQSLADHLTDTGLQYPYEKDAIFHVAYANSIQPGEKLLPWTEQLCPPAVTVFVTELAKYSLNELYQRDDAGLGPLDNVRQEVQRELEKLVDHLGIEILGVGIGTLTLPPAVIEQRIRAWQAEWERQIQVQRAANDAEAVLRLKRARARAQVEIIENITHHIEAMRRTDSGNLTDIITLRMIEAVEEAITDVSLQRTLPQPVLAELMDTSRRVLTWMEKEAKQ